MHLCLLNLQPTLFMTTYIPTFLKKKILHLTFKRTFFQPLDGWNIFCRGDKLRCQKYTNAIAALLHFLMLFDEMHRDQIFYVGEE